MFPTEEIYGRRRDKTPLVGQPRISADKKNSWKNPRNGNISKYENETSTVGKLVVVGKLEYDVKSRGRSVQIRFHRELISQKSKKDADTKLYYINGV